MRLFHSILFLGLWLSRQWRMSEGQRRPKPSISVSSREVEMGGTITIWCAANDFSRKDFSLYKQGLLWDRLGMTQTTNTAVFYISNVTRLAGGRYFCAYCYTGYCSQDYSLYSDPVEIKVTGQPYPKPSITVSPSEAVAVGETVKFHCKNEVYQQAVFSLHVRANSTWHILKWKRATGTEAEFSLPVIQPSRAGIYRCQYCFKSDFYELCSNYSDQAHINVRDPALTKPFIKVKSPEVLSPGLNNITIVCQGPENYLNFSLYKSGEMIASQMSPSDTNATEFTLLVVGLENEGNYTCQYHRTRNVFVWSEPSDPVELIVREVSPQKGPVTVIWTSVAAGLLLVLLLLLAFVLCRKRRKGSTAPQGNQPMNPPIELKNEVDSDGIIYAELSHYSKQAADPDTVSETCAYATVAHNKNGESQ